MVIRIGRNKRIPEPTAIRNRGLYRYFESVWPDFNTDVFDVGSQMVRIPTDSTNI
jgi:hypothetical protein